MKTIEKVRALFVAALCIGVIDTFWLVDFLSDELDQFFYVNFPEMAEPFDRNGRWNVEKNFDHDWHWLMQRIQLGITCEYDGCMGRERR